MTPQNSHLSWMKHYTQRGPGEVADTWVADYHLSHLIKLNQIDRAAARSFLEDHGLRDFHWRITWPEDYEVDDDHLIQRLNNIEGYTIFVHGWTGNWRIWEDVPAMTVLSNRRLIAISVDHNGFGRSLFESSTPSLDQCNPPAAMSALQDWIDLLRIRRQPGETRQKVINLIGHSMGGAMLFYLNPMLWNYGEVTRFALAPALLLEDEGHRIFYTTLGLGIGILQRLPVLEIVERFIQPQMVNTLASGASDFVKEIHRQQYQETPRGITGATFMAMGRLNNYEISHDWQLMRVMLGHRDPLVGLTDMMDLLMKLEFPAANLHVVPGTHYMFSIGSETPLNAYQHAQNREMVVSDIIDLHNRAIHQQKKGQQFG